MSFIQIDQNTCTLCEKCIEVCPFDAMSLKDHAIDINSNCKVCGICVRNCPVKAITKFETLRKEVDKSEYKGISVIAESLDGKTHPVVAELLGKARELAEEIHHPVLAYVLGNNVDKVIQDCLEFGADEVIVIRHQELEHFRADLYGEVLADLIEKTKPCVVLTGATPLGRSLAPKIAARCKTGLTADCTKLEIKENTDLVQIRPAFGGNIMARIVTTHTRPQCATVRYNVFRAPSRRVDPTGKVIEFVYDTKYKSRIEVLEETPLIHDEKLSGAKRIVVAGLGVNDERGLDLVRQLAKKLDAAIAYTRPMIEKGVASYTQQIGLSGRSVQPELIVTCGVSGSVQFAAGMQSSERIIAINSDPNAEIFNLAHVAVIGDAYDVLPKWIDALSKGGYHAL